MEHLRVKSFSKGLKTFANAAERRRARISTIAEFLEEYKGKPEAFKEAKDSFERKTKFAIEDIESELKRLSEYQEEMKDLNGWFNNRILEVSDRLFKRDREGMTPEELNSIAESQVVHLYHRLQEDIKHLPFLKARLAKLKANKIGYGDEVVGKGEAGFGSKVSEGIVIDFDKFKGFRVADYSPKGSWSSFTTVISTQVKTPYAALVKEFEELEKDKRTYYVIVRENKEYKQVEVQAATVDEAIKAASAKNQVATFLSSKDGEYVATSSKELSDATLAKLTNKK